MTRDRGGVWNVDDQRDDALPWLEPVDDETRRGGDSGRIIAIVLIGVGVLALLVAGIGMWRSWFGDGAASGDGAVIAAPDEPYKVRPDDPGGMMVEGKGDSVYAAGQGSDPDGTIDLTAVPEAPIARGPSAEAGDGAVMTRDLPPSTAAKSPPAAAKAPPAKPATSIAAKIDEVVPTTAPAAAPVATGGGAALQLGAFSTLAKAEAAWKSLSGRYSYLAGMSKQVSPVKTGDSTLYRLRAGGVPAASAQSLCSRLKVAGEACSVVTP